MAAAVFDRDVLTSVPDAVSLTVSLKNSGDAEIRNVQVLSDDTVLFTVESLAAGEVVSLKRDVLLSMEGTYIFTARYQNASGEEQSVSSPGITVTVRSSDV